MATLPGLVKDPDPPATDTQISPITIPNGTTLFTTKVWNKIIDYLSGDAGPDFIPQSAIADLNSPLIIKKTSDTLVTFGGVLDPELTFPLPANSVFKVNVYIRSSDSFSGTLGQMLSAGTQFFGDTLGNNAFLTNNIAVTVPIDPTDYSKTEQIAVVDAAVNYEINWFTPTVDYSISSDSFLIAWRIA